MRTHGNVVGRSITGADLARLLARLGPDEEHAAVEYERLRRTLIRFFDWRGASPSDECADPALIASRKLEETPVDDLWNYAHGIARMVLYEYRWRSGVAHRDGGDLPAPLPAPLSEEKEQCRRFLTAAWRVFLPAVARCCSALSGRAEREDFESPPVGGDARALDNALRRKYSGCGSPRGLRRTCASAVRRDRGC
jgi:hypothetical protein